MLSQAAIDLLVTLGDGEKTYDKLTEETGRVKSTISRSASRLETLDLVERRSVGRRTSVRRRQTGVTASLAELEESIPHVDIETVLTPSRLRVLWFLSGPKRPEEIAAFLGIGAPRVGQILRELRRRQIATKTEDGTRLRGEYAELHVFARELVRHVRTVEVRETMPAANVVWTSPREWLVGVPRSATGTVPESFEVTGLAAFGEWGLEFRSSSGPLYYGREGDEEVDLSAEEVVCHTLRRRVDNRRLEYATLLVARTVVEGAFDADRFDRLVAHYDLSETAGRLVQFVTVVGTRTESSDPTQGANRTATTAFDSYPSPRSVRQTAEQYGVDTETAGQLLASRTGTDFTPKTERDSRD